MVVLPADLATQAGAYVGATSFGGGSKSPKGAYVPFGIEESQNDRAQQIISYINQGSGMDQWGINRYTNATGAFTNLRRELEEGKISQSDYLKIADQILPTINDAIYQTSQTGSAAARAISTFYPQFEEIFRNYNLLKEGNKLLGRELTPQEVAKFSPYFQGPNGLKDGSAALASFAEAEAKNPANLGKKAQDFSGQVGGYYQDLLKRGATTEEVDYFGRLLASGQVTPYEIQQFIRATPEFQTTADKEFRGSLSDELGGYDEKAFQRERENILSTYTKAGLQNSSALDFAMTDALSKIQEQRGNFLGQISASQYQGNKESAREDYGRYLDNYMGERDYSRRRSDSTLDYLLERAHSGVDYERQRNDYLGFLSQQPKRSGGNPLMGAITGAGALAPTGNPWLIGAGAGLGAFSYLNQ